MSTDAATDCLSSLDSDQIAAIDRAAALQAPDREPFIEAVYDRLAGQPIGPGSLHRVLAEAQAEFLQARPLLRKGARDGPTKYSQVRHFISKAR